MKKRKAKKKEKEAIPSSTPPPTKNANVTETGAEDLGEEQRKEKKRIKTAAKKRTAEVGVPFEPLVPEMRIIISTLEDSALFSIQSSVEKFRPNLDLDLSDVKVEAREVVPMVSGKYSSEDILWLT